MEKHYMSKIWNSMFSIENKSLSSKQQQDMIESILKEMKIEIEDFTKFKLKKEYTKSIENLLKDI